MRILRLTGAIEEKILARRRGRDVVAERAAARIVRDVRRRGDSALFYWTKRFDRVALQQNNVWVSRDEIRAESPQRFLMPSITPRAIFALSRAARNLRNGPCRWNRACAQASACGPSKRWDAISPAEDFRWSQPY
jgi:histidinol dehydrogenase